MNKNVKKALDDWANTTNLEIMQYYNVSETKSMNNILEDLAQFVWDTKPQYIVHKDCAWKGKEDCCKAVRNAYEKGFDTAIGNVKEINEKLGRRDRGRPCKKKKK